jgi:hypothetical protein
MVSFDKKTIDFCPDGGTGRRGGLKIHFLQESGGSIPPLGTIRKTQFTEIFF